VAGPPRQRIILFDYDPSRGHEVAARLLEGAHGTIQSDGHRAYDQVAKHYGLIHCGCIAHARRKFFEAIKTFSDAERAAVRKEKVAPLLESLNVWATSLMQGTLPSGKLGEALVYLRNQWPKLIRYVEDGQVAIDTNLAERAIRPFALGRRNWLFADTVSGARASAHMYSLVQTARANDLEPYAYLCRLFTELPSAQSVTDIEALLPFRSAG
jgi:transposase